MVDHTEVRELYRMMVLELELEHTEETERDKPVAPAPEEVDCCKKAVGCESTWREAHGRFAATVRGERPWTSGNSTNRRCKMEQRNMCLVGSMQIVSSC